MPGLAADCGTDPAGYLAEGPVLSAFALEEGDVYQAYSTSARGLEFMMSFYGLLDRAPKGRNEGTRRRCGYAATTSTTGPLPRPGAERTGHATASPGAS